MDTNNPSGAPETVANSDAPLSFDAAVENLNAVLDDPEDSPPEPVADEQDNASADEEGWEDPDLTLAEDVEADDDAETDGPEDAEIKGGRFAPDTAKVTLEDGTVITVADLKRNNLFQRDYTKKTQELSEARKAFEQQQSSVSEQAQALNALAEQINAIGQRYLPQPPAPPKPNDPVAYINYLRDKEKYDAAVAEWQGFEQQRQYLTQIEGQKQEQHRQEAVQQEMRALVERDPFFAEPQRVRAFFEEAVDLGSKYWGLNREQVMGLNSGAALQVLREAMLYRKAVERSKDTQQKVQSKPQMGKGGRRADPTARSNSERRARSEQLRKTGSIESAVAVLSNLID